MGSNYICRPFATPIGYRSLHHGSTGEGASAALLKVVRDQHAQSRAQDSSDQKHFL